MSSSERSGETDAVARVRAWANRLQELGRTDDARNVLRAAVDSSDGNTVPLAVELAKCERRAGVPARAIEVLREVLGDDPGDPAAAGLLAETLLAEGNADEAAKVIAAVPHADGDLAELAGEICRAQGRHTQAVAAFGPPAALSQHGRKLRRRSWWRSGGPFRSTRRRDAQSHPAPAARETSVPAEPADELLEVIAWVEWLSDHDRVEEARQAVTEALAAHGRHPRLLRCAAAMEDRADAGHTALYLWREAYRAASEDVEVVCGLADQLASAWTKPSYTWRVQEAIDVLDGFPDQDHPRIRSARASALRMAEVGSSRIVAAYGPADGLPPHDAGDRRRLRWRSAGPLGQFRVWVADRIRGGRAKPLDSRITRTEAESEDVARLLDSLQRERPSAARRRIEGAWEQYGRLPSLLLAYAELDEGDHENWHSLVLAAEAVRASEASLDSVCRLAGALKWTFGYEVAVQVLESLPEAAARQTTEFRVLLGDFHRRAGNFRLAAAAYGDPRDLEKYDRRSRRQCVRKGLLQRRRRGSGERDEAIALTAFDPVPCGVARTLDQAAKLKDQPASARETLNAAIAEHGRHPLLLIELARSEKDRHVSASLAAEAMAAASADPLIFAGGIRELWLANYDSEALQALADLPGELQSSPVVRTAAGEICSYWHLWANTVTCYGDSILEAPARRDRRMAWWRSGGPFRGLRASIEVSEDALLFSLPLPKPQAGALSALELPGEAAAAVRADLGNYRLDLRRRTAHWPDVTETWLNWFFVPVAAIAIFGGLTVAEHLRWPTAGIGGNLERGALAAAAIAVALLISARVVLRIWSGNLLRWGAAVIVAACCGTAAASLVRASGQWKFGAGLALAACAFEILCAFLTARALPVTRRLRLARWQRGKAEMRVLSDLLDLLAVLEAPLRRRDSDNRRWWMTSLERVAAILERDLPYALRSGDVDSQRVIDSHARGAAAALRDMKRTVALPGDASWQRMVDDLRGLATALARGSFEGWPPPQPALAVPRVKRSLWWRVTQAVRTLLVIVGPPLAAFLLPLVAPLNGSSVAWLRFATLVWALLAAIIALDPEISDKVAKMREVLGLLRDSAASKGDSASRRHGARLAATGHPTSGSVRRTAGAERGLDYEPRSARNR